MKLEANQLVRFLDDLVRQPSLSGEEQQVIECVAAEMRGLKYDAIQVDETGSLIGTIIGQQPGQTLLLDAHVDTVGVSRIENWQHNPFILTCEKGRLYGRGTADMKGALAAMVHAAAAVDRKKLKGRVVVSATVLEEVMEGVAFKSVVQAVEPDFVVIGEATNLNLNHGGRGRAEIQLESVGKSAHSSTPYLGLNAVHHMLPAIQAIETQKLPSDPLLGDAIMVLTDIISEPYPGYSVIPARCFVTYDRRLLPGETIDGVLDQLRQLSALANVRATIAEGKHKTYTGAMLRAPKFFPAWKLPADHTFVQSALSGLQAIGLRPSLGAYRFCTNAAYSAGEAAIPTVGFGPAPEGSAHIDDEYVELEQLIAAAHGYLGIIQSVLS